MDKFSQRGVLQKTQLANFLESGILRNSLVAAAKEQGLQELAVRLRRIAPDISGQYTGYRLDTAYLETKVRNLHAFQISLVQEVIGEFGRAVIADIGDSSGAHAQYITGLYAKGRDLETVSVNIDPQAVEKIRGKGFAAIQAPAEEVHKHNLGAEILLSFELLEHLADPCNFLHRLSSQNSAKYLIVTVPYLRRSRVGLHHLRVPKEGKINAENTHIFELSPQDWKLIITHCGWRVVKERVYFQYPKKSPLRITSFLWRKYDFEGFYGLILQKDDTFSRRYLDWQGVG